MAGRQPGPRSQSHLDPVNDDGRNLGKRRRKFQLVDLHTSDVYCSAVISAGGQIVYRQPVMSASKTSQYASRVMAHE